MLDCDALSGLVRRELKTRIKKKEVAQLLRHQRSKNDQGGGKPLAPSQLYIASSIGAIYARCPFHVCSKLHNLEIIRDHDGRSTAPTPGVKVGGPSLELASQCCEKERGSRSLP